MNFDEILSLWNLLDRAGVLIMKTDKKATETKNERDDHLFYINRAKEIVKDLLDYSKISEKENKGKWLSFLAINAWSRKAINKLNSLEGVGHEEFSEVYEALYSILSETKNQPTGETND